MRVDALLPLLACPFERSSLVRSDATLRCGHGHQFAIVDGIPILLRDDVDQTLWVAEAALDVAVGIQSAVAYQPPIGTEVDTFVQETIGKTGGRMFEPLIGRLTDYPIPALPLVRGDGERLLDVGCNWGRWTIAAARLGYAPIGVDPSLEGIRAARRICDQLRIEAAFVVGDARYLPFRDQSIDVAISYSGLQHLSSADVEAALTDLGRVLSPGGTALIQRPNRFGLRSLYHQARRGFRAAQYFEVRYRTLTELRAVFARTIGPARITVDGFFSLNAQPAEAPLLPWRFRVVVALSAWLTRLSAYVTPLTAVADSVWVRAEAKKPTRKIQASTL